jgi:D-3-phosphoglycerate dehydrogenase
MIGILEPADFSEAALSDLKKTGKVKLFDGKDLQVFLKHIKILFVRLYYNLDKEFLNKASQLEIICTPTTGLNHIDLKHCKKRNIKILSLKGETAFLKTIRATPEHTLGLLLGLYRNYHRAFLSMKNHQWNRDPYRGYEIFNSKIGIIGLGRVGTILSGYLLNMGAHVGYYDIRPKKAGSKLYKYDSIPELIKQSETIILCSSYEQESGSIINKKEIDQMKDRYFINTARAELTNEDYLLQAAANGLFKGIAIDVISEEQGSKRTLKKWLELSEKQNIIVTPHIGGATYTSMRRTEEFIVKKLNTEIGR